MACSWGLDLALEKECFSLDAIYQHCGGLGYVGGAFLGCSMATIEVGQLLWMLSLCPVVGVTIPSLGAVSQSCRGPFLECSSQ